MTHLVELDELARTLQLTPRRCQQLADAGEFAKKKRGHYDLCQCAVAYALYLRRNHGSVAKLPCTIHDLAAAIGIKKPQVLYLQQVGVFKKTARGQYDLTDCIRSYIAFLRKKFETWAEPPLFNLDIESEKEPDS